MPQSSDPGRYRASGRRGAVGVVGVGGEPGSQRGADSAVWDSRGGDGDRPELLRRDGAGFVGYARRTGSSDTGRRGISLDANVHPPVRRGFSHSCDAVVYGASAAHRAGGDRGVSLL